MPVETNFCNSRYHDIDHFITSKELAVLKASEDCSPFGISFNGNNGNAIIRSMTDARKIVEQVDKIEAHRDTKR